MEESFVVRFRGVRGTYAVPGATTVRYGGNTACVEVRVGSRLIILDAGTGVVNLGDELMEWHRSTGQPIVATIFFSHTHHDHTQGFPFFTPAYEGSSKFYMFGPKTFDQDLADALSRAMLAPIFPVALEELPSLKIITNISDTEALLIGPENEPQIRNIFREDIDTDSDTIRVSVLRSPFHPSGGVSVFRIAWNGKSVVYATDTEGVSGGDTRLIRFARHCDLLIHDAQYTAEEYLNLPRQGWGHSTPEMAIAVAQHAQARHLVLFHHDPLHDDAQLDDMQALAQQRFPNTVMAYEGLTITL
jgi:phosphoribosyl 1,2-cyclic phosphodiesterase